ncbi:hypothetical protein B0T14DRAFT_507823 [Immersiella caudata]|uniref:Transcription factor n=1 Tax=Immersiella caudata TaxID=314043 RepID=A0AA40CDT6_9PEZI|nr:hypothetical protein B0T14DRAFT_507823 [Immersiella caudata]
MSGFSVFQPVLGDALQWLPALGTVELDEMIHATIPGPSSIADKRAHIAMDFFEYSQQTGKNFKFYSAPASFASTTAASPASSAAVYDSGYGSNFNASPVVSDMSAWTPSTTAYTPSVSAEETRAKPQSASRKSTASSSKQADFSNHPGMRIMTKDGRDVTNSASRGCKTKEQRDHAHLMRIIKACDACKRKKIRCDPSHKKRTASTSSQEVKPAKKAKKASPPSAPAWDMHDFPAPSTSGTPEGPSSSPFEYSDEELWSQFVMFPQEPTLATDFNPDDYDFSDSFDFSVPDFTPSSSTSSSSPPQWFAPFTPVPAGPSPPVATSETFPDTSPQDLNLPYLNPGSHGSDYVDFNLYSPPADFFLDEEPVAAKKALASGARRQQSPQPSLESQGTLRQQPTESIVVAHSGQYYSSPSPFQSDAFHSDGQQSGVRRLDEYRYAATVMSSSSDRQHSQARGDPIIQGLDSSGGLQSIPRHSRLANQSSPTSSSAQRCSDGRNVGSQQLDPAPTTRSPQPSIRPEVKTSAPPGVTQNPGADRPADYHDPEISPTSFARDGRVSVTCSRATRGRPLSTGQQLQTVSTHAIATIQPSLTRPHESTVSGLAERSSVSISPSVTVPGEYCRTMSASLLTAPFYLESSSTPGSRAAAGTSSGDTSHALTAVLTTVLLTTLPMRRLVDGESAKNGQPLSSHSLFQLAVFGLISSLLVSALQNKFLGTQADLQVCLNVLIITSLSFASVYQRYTRSSATMSPCSRAASLPVPMPTSTIDNVKTKIHGLGQMVDGLRCAVSQRLRAVLPRSRSLSLIRF